MNLQEGSWLGVDVGSSRGKVLNFCLVEVDGDGGIRVAFERGQARATSTNTAWPSNTAKDFLDLSRPSLLSDAAEGGLGKIIERSELVQRWSHASKRLKVAAAVDAPCGFADVGATIRHTEVAAAKAFRTPDRDIFRSELQHFAKLGKDTPLQQRFFWKLVGLQAYRELMAIAGEILGGADFDDVTRSCDGHRSNSRVTLREAFPSDTYARANGTLGTLRKDASEVLGALVRTPWTFAGNRVGVASSEPTVEMQQKLKSHRLQLLAEVHAGHALKAMQKVHGDPSWADLWDAFACAYVVVCEAHGASSLLGTDRARLSREGAITAPATALA